MTTDPPDDYAVFLKEKVYKAFYPDGMTPEEQALDEAYGRLRAAMDAEDAEFRRMMRTRRRWVAEHAPELLRDQGYDVPEDLKFIVEES